MARKKTEKNTKKIPVDPGPAEAAETARSAAEEAAAPDAEVQVQAEEACDIDLEAQRDEFKDKWLRALAELDNLRKRSRREINDARMFTRIDMIRELLDVLDNFERVDTHRPDDTGGSVEFDLFVGGVQLVHERLRTILSGYGLQKLDVEKGMEFDPVNHEAVAHLEGTDVPSGAIIDVAQAGYMLGDIIVRPARVAVAK